MPNVAKRQYAADQIHEVDNNSGNSKYGLDHNGVGDALSQTVNLRGVATSAGDYRIAVMQEVQRVLDAKRRHPLRAAKAGLERLHEDGIITQKDVKTLGEICEIVFAVERGKTNALEGFSDIRTVYNEMLVENQANPVALAIASIAASGSVVTVPDGIPEGAVAAISRSDTVDSAIVGGAIIGAGIGGVLGGGAGAIVGAVIGGIAAGGAAACATADDDGGGGNPA